MSKKRKALAYQQTLDGFPELPAVQEERIQATVDPMSVACTYCEEPAGKPCVVTGYGRRERPYPHTTREIAADRIERERAAELERLRAWEGGS